MDDTAAIQNILNKISITRPALFFPEGKYKITQPLNLTSTGSGVGGIYYGCGFCSVIEYYPPVNATSSADGFSGIIKAGSFNFGGDNEYASFRDLRFVLKNGATNGACAIKGFKFFKGEIRNIIIEDFECGIHLSNSWSVTITNCAIKNCIYGILWDNTTIGTITKSDFFNCNIAIYFGWNLFGLNNIEPLLFAEGFTISENTIQSCKEAAIVGKNVQVLDIKGNYTEGNCVGPYTNLASIHVLNSTKMNGAEIIISNDNPYGSSKISLQNNWFWINKSVAKSPLGLKDCYGLSFLDNSVYATEFIQGPQSVIIILDGSNDKFVTDQTLKLNGSGSYTGNTFYGNKSNLPSNYLADFSTVNNLAIPANLSKILFIPFSCPSCIGFNQILLTVASDIAQDISIGIFENYRGSFVRTFYDDNVIKAYNSSNQQLNIKLSSKCVMPSGNFIVGISFKGQGTVSILTLTKPSTNFFRSEQLAFHITADFVNKGTYTSTDIESFIQLPQIILV